MGKTKHNPPGKKKADFIKFGKVQQNYLIEVQTRTLKEFNDALNIVYEELGIVEKLKQAPPGTYKLRLRDLSGLDVLPSPQKPGPVADPSVDPPKETDPLEKKGKDN